MTLKRTKVALATETKPAATRAAATDFAATARPPSPRIPRPPPDQALTFIVAAGAALPVIASTVRGLREGWMPSGDQAVIATRAYDVFSSHAPLVGQFSSSSHVTDHATFSLGPLLYWLLALPARFGSPGSIALTMGIVNALAVAGTIVLARRRGGIAFMVVAGIAIALMTRSLAPETFHDPWNPSAALLPFTLLVFLCWSVACGERRLLPLTVLVASFVVQCHLTYVLPATGMLLVAVAGLAVSRRARVWPWAAASAAVAAIVWAPPLIDEATGNQGNLTTVAQTALASKPTLGWNYGWHAIEHAIGITPWWLHVVSDPFFPATDVATSPGALAAVSSIVILAALAALFVLAAVRRRVDAAAGAAIALILCAALAAVTMKTPSAPSLARTLGYTLWWGSPAGMCVWLILLLLVGRELSGRLSLRRVAIAALPLAVLPIVAGAAAAARQQPDEHRLMYRPVAALGAILARNVAGGLTVKLDGSPGFSAVLRAGVRYELRRRGIRALGVGEIRWGAWYLLRRQRTALTIYIEDNHSFPPKSGRPVGRVRWLYGPRWHTLTVFISAAAERPRR